MPTRQTQYGPGAKTAGLRPFLAAALVTLGGASAVAADPPAGVATPEQAEFFETKVRPVLAESCQKCHGPSKQSGGLRLDSRAAFLEGGTTGPSIVAGKPDESLLIQAVRQTHEDVKMPPKGKLPPAAVDALANWVKMGAPWPSASKTAGTATADSTPTHWAFLPVQAVAPPTVTKGPAPHTPVDNFIAARLDREGLTMSAEADRHTLIRRATFDITGLPPTAAEVDAFLADTRVDAFERVVDRLLASPRYGERWGRHWLDIARYSDTKGYVFVEERRYPYAYTYRDYVVRALNDDLPYDQFIVEQLAADRLGPGHDRRSLAALGFLTLGRRFLNNREDIIDDRIDVVSRGLLGLTVACARCHDHKFDPIPTDDYYALFGVFASSVEPADLPEIPASVPESLLADFRAQLAKKEAAVKAFETSKRAEVEANIREKLGEFLRLGVQLGFDPRNPKLDEQARAVKLKIARVRGVASRWKTYVEATKNKPDPVMAPWHAFAALPAGEFAVKAPGLAKELRDRNDPKNPVNSLLAKSLADDPPKSLAEVAARYGAVVNEAARSPAGPARDELLRLVDFSNGPLAIKPDAFNRILDRDERNRLNEVTNALAALKASHAGSPPRAMVLNDAPTPFEPRVLVRGNAGRPGKVVPRQFLKVVAGPDRKPFRDGSGRLELARAIADPSNPLTARVLVNRVWLHHFGTGLVGTPSDFGTRSDPPTHPELLDWLADDFVRHGWSVKHLHRRMMLSAAYRQQSLNRPEAVAKDSENRLVWKFNRQRLEFEAIRDALLASAGTLDTTMGGRSVEILEPPFPPRRTIYGAIDRQNLDGLYRTFDFASPDSSTPRRFTTTVPQQALFLLNSPFVVSQAKALAARPETSATDPAERLRKIYRVVFGRQPDASESTLGLAFVDRLTRAGSTLPPPDWRYGWTSVDESTGKADNFQPLPHWTGSGWQMADKLPSPEAGYLHWHAGGGHTGPDAKRSAVLRWTARREATVNVRGTLGHDAAMGDGVRGRLLDSRGDALGTWVAHNAKVATEADSVSVRAGDTLDFVVDPRTNDAFDGFSWAPVIREVGSWGPGPASTWDARLGFHGPSAQGLSPWEAYAQVLLLTNEFVFVD